MWYYLGDAGTFRGWGLASESKKERDLESHSYPGLFLALCFLDSSDMRALYYILTRPRASPCTPHLEELRSL